MSDQQLDYLAKQRKTLQLQIENSARAQKVADLKFYNRQKLLYPNAEIFYEPTTYSSLIQDEAQSLNTSNDRNKALLEAELYTITTNKNIIRQILATLTDSEIEALVYFFPDFKNELMKNTKTNAVSYEVFIAFARKYLVDKFVFFNNIKTQSQQTPIPTNPINPIFPQTDSGFAEMKMDVDEENLPTKEKTKREEKAFVPFKKQKAIELKTNRNIGIMGRNNQNSNLNEKVEPTNRPTTEQTERNSLPPEKRKPKREAYNPKPAKKRAIIENITGKRKGESDKVNPPKKKQDTRPETGPFSDPNREQRGFYTPPRLLTNGPFSNPTDDNNTRPRLTNGPFSNPSTGTGLQPPFTMNEMIENTELTDFEKLKNIMKFYPNLRNLILSPHNPNSNWTYQQTISLMNSFMERNPNYATNKMKIIKDKFYEKKSLVNNGAGNKNRFVFQGKGITDEMGHHKFYVDMKLLNKNILAVKYHSTRNYKLKSTPINDDVKSMVMDILLDKFNQKLFDLLKNDEKTLIIRFVQSMKLENVIPIKDDKLQEYFKQFLILKGEYLNGNDNPEIKKALRKYTLELMDMKKLPKHAGFALLHELSL